MQYPIQKLTINNHELAKQLISQIQAENGLLNPLDISDNYLSTLLLNNTFHAWVAVDGMVVTGGLTAYELPMFASEENEMFLYDIIVHKNYRQKGIAKSLIEELKTTCRTKGIKTIFVGTNMDSKAAIQLYQSTGAKRENIPWFTYKL